MEPIIQNYFSILFYSACNVFFSKRVEKTSKTKNYKEEIFQSFIAEVEQNYRKEHEVGFYAEKLCLSPKYLSKLIYNISEKTAAEWIKEYILLEATTMLKSTSMTIQQISDELNFANQSHFGRFFKRYTGVSPKKYRR